VFAPRPLSSVVVVVVSSVANVVAADRPFVFVLNAGTHKDGGQRVLLSAQLPVRRLLPAYSLRTDGRTDAPNCVCCLAGLPRYSRCPLLLLLLLLLLRLLLAIAHFA
jgi:hypothetical protein